MGPSELVWWISLATGSLAWSSHGPVALVRLADVFYIIPATHTHRKRPGSSTRAVSSACGPLTGCMGTHQLQDVQKTRAGSSSELKRPARNKTALPIGNQETDIDVQQQTPSCSSLQDTNLVQPYLFGPSCFLFVKVFRNNYTLSILQLAMESSIADYNQTLLIQRQTAHPFSELISYWQHPHLFSLRPFIYRRFSHKVVEVLLSFSDTILDKSFLAHTHTHLVSILPPCLTGTPQKAFFKASEKVAWASSLKSIPMLPLKQPLRQRLRRGRNHERILVKSIPEKPTIKNIDDLPDELLERILYFVGLDSSSIDPDPFKVGWADEMDVICQGLAFARSLGVLRLVSWRFLRLVTPIFFKRLIISDFNSDILQGGRFIVGLTQLLSTSLSKVPPPSKGPDPHLRIKAGDTWGKQAHFGNQIAYGSHVRQLVISCPTIEPRLVLRLLDSIHSLLPNLTELSYLNSSQFPILLSPTISFPRLEALTGVQLRPVLSSWTTDLSTGESSHPTFFDPRSSFVSHEVFFGFLNHHPFIKHLSCRGLELRLVSATRLIALLQSNQLVVPLLPRIYLPTQFVGLKSLHLGHHSLVDLHLFRLLPRAAPHLEQLHVDAECEIEDNTEENHDHWSICAMMAELPRLTHLTFIAQHELPAGRDHTSWAASDCLLKSALGLKSLNVRADSFRTAAFFNDLGNTPLQSLNVWYKPLLSSSNKDWSVVSFCCPEVLKNLGYFARNMTRAGLEWPKGEELRRDLWLKFRCLCYLLERGTSNIASAKN
ncbi:hypothetical protein O181_052947 [Austropuccinia psidii MF-1]|uniref:F-box domain-containing protein n=1 Tax=Austropuccinia psidii MF-1 TaxID=1389203 RepID=A0A9Q3E3Z1_9BASI|nr:hypothetical protein [Austropuccinia psidii MF-1]